MGMKSVELRNWRKIYSLQRFLAIPCSSFTLSAGGDLLANCYEAHDRNQATQPEVRVELRGRLILRVTCRGRGGAGGVWAGGAPAATTAPRTPGWCPGRGRGWSGARGRSHRHQGSQGGSLNIANNHCYRNHYYKIKMPQSWMISKSNVTMWTIHALHIMK